MAVTLFESKSMGTNVQCVPILSMQDQNVSGNLNVMVYTLYPIEKTVWATVAHSKDLVTTPFSSTQICSPYRLLPIAPRVIID